MITSLSVLVGPQFPFPPHKLSQAPRQPQASQTSQTLHPKAKTFSPILHEGLNDVHVDAVEFQHAVRVAKGQWTGHCSVNGVRV